VGRLLKLDLILREDWLRQRNGAVTASVAPNASCRPSRAARLARDRQRPSRRREQSGLVWVARMIASLLSASAETSWRCFFSVPPSCRGRRAGIARHRSASCCAVTDGSPRRTGARGPGARAPAGKIMGRGLRCLCAKQRSPVWVARFASRQSFDKPRSVKEPSTTERRDSSIVASGHVINRSGELSSRAFDRSWLSCRAARVAV
jgi:hypothetical protein